MKKFLKFISNKESKLIIKWIDKLDYLLIDSNHHLNEISKSLNGKSFIFDISRTYYTKYITEYQSVSDIYYKDDIPKFIYKIMERIVTSLNIPKDHIFLQVVDMRSGGKISPHYDASIDGFINYKCNLSVLSENYKIYIGEDYLDISQGDMYCFESSLYKHWTNEFNSRRIFLSFGFIVPYSYTNRSEDDPRVRLSKRIKKYFQNL